MKSPYGLPCIESCLSCKLRTDHFVCALSQKSLETFNQIKHGAVFPEGTVIFVEGQAPRGIFMLCQGQAKLSTTSREGKTFILRIAKSGEVLGLHSTVTGEPYELTAETMRPSQLDFVSREDFLGFLDDHGDARMRAVQDIARDCQSAYDVVRSIGLLTSIPGRVAKFLLESAADGKVKNGAVSIGFSLTQEEISQLMGTSRESVTRTLADFRKKNLVELKGSTLTILDKPALERLVTV